MVLNVMMFNLTFIIVSCAALVALNLTCIYMRNVKSKQYQALDKAAQFSLILVFVAISLAIVDVTGSAEKGFGIWLLCYLVGGLLAGTLFMLTDFAGKRIWKQSAEGKRVKIKVPFRMRLALKILFVLSELSLGSFLVYECIMKDIPLLDASWLLSAFIFAGAAIEAWSIRTEYLKHKRL